MANNEKTIKDLVLAKVWNQILSDNILPKDCQQFSDINNHAFRLNLIINSNERKNSEEIDHVVDKCNQFVIKNSKLDHYLSLKNKNIEQTEIDISENSFSEINKHESKKTENLCENDSENAKKSFDIDSVGEPFIENSITINRIATMILSIKKAMDEENSPQIQQIINDIASNYDQQSAQFFCINFLNIENFKTEIFKTSNLESIDLSIQEHQIYQFFENLIQLNSSITLVSYNISCLFLKLIFFNFIVKSIETDSGNEQISRVLSRKMLNLSVCLCDEFQRQFIVSCLVPFIVEANSKISNKIFVEFFMKLIKENLNESGCNDLFTILLNDFNSIKWTEIVYSVLSVLIEKISNLNNENIELVLNKMKNDSIDLCKSTIFSKFLLNLLNKFKNRSVVKIVQNQNFENQSFQSLSQLCQSKNNKISKESDSDGFNKRYIETIETIIANNKTLIKKTLQNMIKNFKS
ncbi:hypothetical protein BpHYR1_037940 [Brachionus plicatilis]|uniref:Uncharacterized protein n=1 Tax=Brachionus plicatilis TaxID=10195 RepID=A0A3M7QEI0_BRAPC|nr:hypothetical protein BpHYR1_037940 [Brachionus plicatilis]